MQPMQRKQIFWLNSTENLWTMSLRSCLRYLLLAYMTWASVWTYAAEPIINGAVNADETLLVTVQGKKATVWEISTRKKLYDVQMLEEDWIAHPKYSGKIMVASFDPKNRWLIVAGWASKIYFFDVGKGNLVKKVSAYPEVTDDICLSPNNNLMATISNGIYLWNLSELPSSYIKKINGEETILRCVFVNNNIVALSSKGYFTYYSKDGSIIDKYELPHGFYPLRIFANSKNNQFAVTGVMKNIVKNEYTIYTGGFLPFSLKEKINFNNPDNMDFARGLAWSIDGNELFFGGKYRDKDKYKIIKWNNTNLEKVKFLKQDGDSFIQKLITLKDGSIVVITAYSPWFLIQN
ncbi:hypothetical protein [Cardiobacterium hominis]|uniref:WD40 repeat domain-containing protein n=1 Tax=Cardiobacterium hominis TaxID=2718 RepID=UPI0028EAA5DC|nr:hypothetical protein [Cardiobacterium hominis]